MIETLSHKNSVSDAIAPLQAKIDELKAKEQRLLDEAERVEEILGDWAGKKDGVTAAIQQAEQILNKGAKMRSDWSPERLFEQFSTTPLSIEQLTERLSQLEMEKKYRKRLKKYLHDKFILTAERDLYDLSRPTAPT